MMKALRGGMLAVLLAGGTTAAVAAEKTVNIFNWSDYIGASTLADFTTATGFPTRYDVYDSLETLEQKVLAGRSGYDLIVPTAEPTMGRLIKSKALLPLDQSKLPNFANLDPALMKAVATTDPGNKYGAIYLWGTIGLGINPPKLRALMPDAPLNSWDLLFKPELAAKFASCGIIMMDSAIDVVPSVLKYLGLDPGSEKREDLEKVEALLMKIRPFIRKFASGQNIDLLASGEACLVFTYSGDALQARKRAEEAKGGVEVDYVIPKEGAQLWFDVISIPADAPNPAGAHAFINYILKPEVMAGISNAVQYPNAVPASRPLLDPAVRDNPSVYPSAESMARMFTVKAQSPQAERQRSRMWTRVKSGK